MKITLIIVSAMIILVMASCTTNTPKQVIKEDVIADTSTITIVDPKLVEENMRHFLYATEGTYGWETKANDITFDFFKDGRLHIQGPDGEATMWQGTWKLDSDQLTMLRVDLNRSITQKVTIMGDTLLLDSIAYNRIKL